MIGHDLEVSIKQLFSFFEIVPANTMNTINYEFVLCNYLSENTGLDIVHSTSFKKNYPQANAETQAYERTNAELTPETLVFNSTVPDMIVHEPNNSQRWPDLMVIKNGVGYPIEIKTSKTTPKMNSGMFRSNCLYVVLHKTFERRHRVAYGKDFISKADIILSRHEREQAMRLVKTFKVTGFRPVHDTLDYNYFPDDFISRNEKVFEDVKNVNF